MGGLALESKVEYSVCILNEEIKVELSNVN